MKKLHIQLLYFLLGTLYTFNLLNLYRIALVTITQENK